MDFLKYINPGIESINPYEAGKSIEEVMEKYNLEDIVKLASNENNSGPSTRALKIIKYFKDLHIYPDGDAIKLKTKISEVENIDSDHIIEQKERVIIFEDIDAVGDTLKDRKLKAKEKDSQAKNMMESLSKMAKNAYPLHFSTKSKLLMIKACMAPHYDHKIWFFSENYHFYPFSL